MGFLAQEIRRDPDTQIESLVPTNVAARDFGCPATNRRVRRA